MNINLNNQCSKSAKKINLKKIEKILKNIKEYEAKINDIDLEIAELKDLQSISIKGINYDNLIRTNSLFSKTEMQVIKDLKIDQTISVLEYQKRHIERFLSKIKNALDSLEEQEKEIIQLKYFENELWRSITFKVNLEERQCRGIKRNALEKIASLIMNCDLRIVDTM